MILVADPDNDGLDPKNPAQAEGATVVAEHPIHGKIRKIEGEIKGHFINAAKNIGSTRRSFGPISTIAGILAPSPGTNSLSEYWGGVKERASEYINSIKGMPALADQLLKASGVSISPAMPPSESNLDHIAQLKNAYAQLELVNGLASEIEQLTADLRAASHGNNRAKGKLGLDVFVTALTEGLGRYVKGVKTLKSDSFPTPVRNAQINERHYLDASKIAKGNTSPSTVAPASILKKDIKAYNKGEFKVIENGDVSINGRIYGVKNEGKTLFPRSGGAKEFIDLSQGQIKAIQTVWNVHPNNLEKAIKGAKISQQDFEFAKKFVLKY